MFKTGLTENEKESLIKWICTQGQIITKNNKKVFEFFDKELDIENQFTPACLLEKALRNILEQTGCK